MSILVMIIGAFLVYMGAFRKSQSKISNQTVDETVKDLSGKPLGGAVVTVAKYGIKIYLKIMMIAFGIGLFLMGLIGWLMF